MLGACLLDHFLSWQGYRTSLLPRFFTFLPDFVCNSQQLENPIIIYSSVFFFVSFYDHKLLKSWWSTSNNLTKITKNDFVKNILKSRLSALLPHEVYFCTFWHLFAVWQDLGMYWMKCIYLLHEYTLNIITDQIYLANKDKIRAVDCLY